MTESHTSAGRVGGARTFADELKALPERQRGAALVEFMRAEIAERLFVEASEVDPRAQLMALGMSSLKAVELKTRLEEELGMSLRSSLMFDYPTLDVLAPFLLERLGLVGVQAAPERRPPLAEQSVSADLSDTDDVAALLAAELADLAREG